MEPVLLIHYSEIGTKGKNRSYFEKRLRDDIAARLKPGPLADLRLESSRLIGRLAPGAEPKAVHAGMEQCFGVAWYAFARMVSWDWEEIAAAALACAAERPQAKTFKVFCKRADKTFPLSSQAVCEKLGTLFLEKTPMKVNLDNHDVAIYVEVVRGKALVYAERFPGLRGMPSQSSGKMLCLFSGGIDSPVAAWLMMRRGAQVGFLHFHPHRNAGEIRGSKIPALFQVLKTFNPNARLYLIPHFHYQVKAALEIPTAYEMVIFRRFMIKTAEALAAREGYQALIMGDSLGQVASQTVENIVAAQHGVDIPIFTPCVAQDKDDIVRLAQKIGTYELSTQEYKDCCSLMSRHPKTMVRLEQALALEAKLNLDDVIDASLKSLEVWRDAPAAVPS